MTTTALLIVTLAAIGAWRLWNYEDIFAEFRRELQQHIQLKPLWCAACNAFWFALAAVMLSLGWEELPVKGALSTLALYTVLRTSQWIIEIGQKLSAQFKPSKVSDTNLIVNAGAYRPEIKPLEDTYRIPDVPESICPSCAEKTKAVKSTVKVVVLMTLLGDFNPAYSLVTCILGQARMLAAEPTWRIILVVQEGCDMRQYPKDMPTNVEVRAFMPAPRYEADAVDDNAAYIIGVAMIRGLHGFLEDTNVCVITHDLLFLAHFINHAKAIHCWRSPLWIWFHQAHSAAAKTRAPEPAASYRCTLPAGHFLICLNSADAPNLAAYYNTTIDRVRVVPNARDLGEMRSMTPLVKSLADEQSLALADIVQVYPLSGPRMDGKGVPMVIRIFAALQRMGFETRLVIANAHSNGKDVVDMIAGYRRLAGEVGLPRECLVFTSEAKPDRASQGLTQIEIADLLLYANVFIFPTVSEASPLVLMEAALAGCLIVTNSSVPTLADIVPHDMALTYAFGGERQPGQGATPEQIATDIVAALNTPAQRAKRHVLRRHSYTAIGATLRQVISAT